MAHPLFITSTGTEQGKTYVTRLLCKQLGGAYAVKPVVSGFTPEDPHSDTRLILEASASGLTVEQCSPWRFKEPLSPDLAARKEGREIPYAELTSFCQNPEIQIIEGAGGVMSPLTPHQTNLDLMRDSGASALLVSSLYLGCISHILTALSVLRANQVPIAGLVLSPATAQAMEPETVLASLKPHLEAALPLFVLKYHPNFDESWQAQTNLISVMEKR